MKTLMILFGMVLAAPAFAACGASRPPVIDWGLHRQYEIERDCTHPERPASLVEVPWSDIFASRAREDVRVNVSAPAKQGRPLYLVHAGMRVTLAGQTATGGLHLVGMALEQGSLGDAVRVKAGLHGAILHGVVRGPGQVELELQKGQN